MVYFLHRRDAFIFCFIFKKSFNLVLEFFFFNNMFGHLSCMDPFVQTKLIRFRFQIFPFLRFGMWSISFKIKVSRMNFDFLGFVVFGFWHIKGWGVNFISSYWQIKGAFADSGVLEIVTFGSLLYCWGVSGYWGASLLSRWSMGLYV